MSTIIYAGLFELPDQDAAAHRVNGISRVLMDGGFDVILVGISKDSRLIENGKIKYYGESYPKCGRDWLHLQLQNKLLLQIINSEQMVEAVILYNYPSFIFDRVRRLCKRKRIKLVSDCTEWYHSGHSERLWWLKNLDTFKRMHLDNRRVDGIIVISSFLERYYAKKRSIRIPPVFDYRITRKKLSECIAEKRKFIFSGTVTKQKEGITNIIESALNLEDKHVSFELIILGVDREHFLYDNPSLKDRLEKSNCIFFRGRVSHEESLAYLQQSDFQIFIRMKTRVNQAGFSTKFAESFACGIPVITTNTSDLAEFLSNGDTGFWVTDDLEECMERICKMTQDEIVVMKKKVCECMAFDYRTYSISLLNWMKEK